jgi:hypothetical protein
LTKPLYLKRNSYVHSLVYNRKLPPAKAVRQNQELTAGSIKYFMKTTRLVLAIMTLCAGHINAGTQEQLTAYRQQIDSLDQRMFAQAIPMSGMAGDSLPVEALGHPALRFQRISTN